MALKGQIDCPCPAGIEKEKETTHEAVYPLRKALQAGAQSPRRWTPRSWSRSPVTRRVEKLGAYNRAKARSRDRAETGFTPLLWMQLCFPYIKGIISIERKNRVITRLLLKTRKDAYFQYLPMNGVQEAGSSNLLTRTKKRDLKLRFWVSFALFSVLF